MIPKNKRRTITVNGEEFEYCVTNSNHQIVIFAKNLKNMEEYHWHCDADKDHKVPITPKDICDLIAHGGLWGTAAKYKAGKKK